MAEAVFDNYFAQAAGQLGSLDALLDAFFGFLHRRTDLYVVLDEQQVARGASMGFPPGTAEGKVLQAFRKWPYKGYRPSPQQPQQTSSRTQTQQPRRPQKQQKQQQPKKKKNQAQRQSSASSLSSSTLNTVETVDTAATAATTTSAVSAATDEGSGGGDGGDAVPLATERVAAKTETGTETETKVQTEGIDDDNRSPAAPGSLTAEGKQIAVGNGGWTDNYFWTQSISEVTVYVDVDPDTRGRDLQVEITPSRLLIQRKDGNAPIVDGTFGEGVKASDCMWVLESGQVVLTLEKKSRTWWKCILQGDPEIDTTTIDSTVKMHDYDEETQAGIRKIMFDQRQRAKGLPTSDELQQNALLESAKNLPGSPFLPGGPLAEDVAPPAAAAAAASPQAPP